MNTMVADDKHPWGQPPLQAGPPRPILFRHVASVLAVLAAVVALMGAFYTVQPTEMAGVRRLGPVVSKEPVDSGLSYRVPESAVLRLLYGVGRSGNVDIVENIRPVLADRVLRVFSTQNTVSISANREQIAGAIRKEVGEALQSIFGIEITDLQLRSITYSPSFQASVEAAAQAKNDVIRAENTVVKIRYEGEQQKVQADAQAAVCVAQANGEAQATVARARSEREAAILRAEGDAQAATLLGDAQAHGVQQVGTAVAANPRVVSYETAHRWTGQMPSTVLVGGGGTGPLALLNLPSAGR